MYIYIYIYIGTPHEYEHSNPRISIFASPRFQIRPLFSGNDRAPTSCGSSMGDLGEGRHDLEGFGESLIWDTIFGGNGFMMVSSCFMMFNDVFDDVPSIWPFFCINIMDTRMTDLLAHYEPMVV